jgi:hypothetical protein
MRKTSKYLIFLLLMASFHVMIPQAKAEPGFIYKKGRENYRWAEGAWTDPEASLGPLTGFI